MTHNPEETGHEKTEEPQEKKQSLHKARHVGSSLKSGIEFFGRHPLITGVLGILGIVALIISIQSYRIDRSESGDATNRLEELQKGVSTVEERIIAECSSPPCWTLSEIMQVSIIGRSKDLLDTKLPPAEFVRNNQFQYIIDDCRLNIEYRQSAVSYVSSELYRVGRSTDGSLIRTACPFEVPGIFDTSSYSNYPTFPRSNLDVKVRDIFSLRYNDNEVNISNACIECGNYAEPYIEFLLRGPHSSGFIDLYFSVHSSRFQNDNSYDQWGKMKINFASVGPTPEDHFDVQTTDHCERNVTKQITPLLDFGIERIGIGYGRREWSGPPVFFCQ